MERSDLHAVRQYCPLRLADSRETTVCRPRGHGDLRKKAVFTEVARVECRQAMSDRKLCLTEIDI